MILRSYRSLTSIARRWRWNGQRSSAITLKAQPQTDRRELDEGKNSWRRACRSGTPGLLDPVEEPLDQVWEIASRSRGLVFKGRFGSSRRALRQPLREWRRSPAAAAQRGYGGGSLYDVRRAELHRQTIMSIRQLRLAGGRRVSGKLGCGESTTGIRGAEGAVRIVSIALSICRASCPSAVGTLVDLSMSAYSCGVKVCLR